MRIPIRRSQHSQRRRATTQTLEGDIKVHVGRAVIYSSFEIESARGVINARNPVGRAKRRAGGLVGGQGGREDVVAEEPEHLVRRAEDRLGRVGGVRDEVRGPLVAVEVLEQRRVRNAPDTVCVAFGSQEKDGLGNGADPVGPYAILTCQRFPSCWSVCLWPVM